MIPSAKLRSAPIQVFWSSTGWRRTTFTLWPDKPLEFLGLGELALDAGRAHFHGVPSAGNHIFDVQDGAHVLRDVLAIGVRDAFRFVDENAQNPGTAAAQHLDVDDFQALIGAYPFRDFPHFFYDGRPVRHVSLPLRSKGREQ